MPSTSGSHVDPYIPPVGNDPAPDEPPIDPAGCSGSDCTCPMPPFGDGEEEAPADEPRQAINVMRRQAVAAIAAVMPPPAGTGGGRAAGSPYRINPANGRVRTAISPPSAGKFDTMPSFYYNSTALGATEYGFGWTGSFRRQVTEIDPSTADVTLDNGNVCFVTRTRTPAGNMKQPMCGKEVRSIGQNSNCPIDNCPPCFFRSDYGNRSVDVGQ